MNFIPNDALCEPILDAWIRQQVELLSVQAVNAGAEIRPVAQVPHCTYAIAFNGEVVCCSPEKAYATLHFLQALQERSQRDVAHSQTGPKVFFDSIQIKQTFDFAEKKHR
ncbi:MAG: hypothetical protein AAFX01_09145 [Cyanobacteria bacterium J06638_28]